MSKPLSPSSATGLNIRSEQLLVVLVLISLAFAGYMSVKSRQVSESVSKIERPLSLSPDAGEYQAIVGRIRNVVVRAEDHNSRNLNAALNEHFVNLDAVSERLALATGGSRLDVVSRNRTLRQAAESALVAAWGLQETMEVFVPALIDFDRTATSLASKLAAINDPKVQMFAQELPEVSRQIQLKATSAIQGADPAKIEEIRRNLTDFGTFMEEGEQAVRDAGHATRPIFRGTDKARSLLYQVATQALGSHSRVRSAFATLNEVEAEARQKAAILSAEAATQGREAMADAQYMSGTIFWLALASQVALLLLAIGLFANILRSKMMMRALKERVQELHAIGAAESATEKTLREYEKSFRLGVESKTAPSEQPRMSLVAAG